MTARTRSEAARGRRLGPGQPWGADPPDLSLHQPRLLLGRRVHLRRNLPLFLRTLPESASAHVLGTCPHLGRDPVGQLRGEWHLGGLQGEGEGVGRAPSGDSGLMGGPSRGSHTPITHLRLCGHGWSLTGASEALPTQQERRSWGCPGSPDQEGESPDLGFLPFCAIGLPGGSTGSEEGPERACACACRCACAPTGPSQAKGEDPFNAARGRIRGVRTEQVRPF